MTDVVTVIRTLVVLLLIALSVILLTRRLAVPYTLGLVVVGLLCSLLGLLSNVRLTPDLVLFVFLPALLFEGSWSLSLGLLRAHWLTVFVLVVPGLLLALVMIALPLHFLAGLSWESALLLAAILSPTDPVAVLGLFRQLKVHASLATIIEGESLLNDGVAGALYQTFLALLLLSLQGQALSVGQAWVVGGQIVLLEAGGGIFVGGVCGFVVSRFVKLIDEPLIETTMTIVAAYGVYLLADALHMSGILAVIVAGLIIAEYGQRGMSETTRKAVDNFWTVIAFVANALVFLLVGLQLNPTKFLLSARLPGLLITAGLAVLAVLLTRLAMVLLLPLKREVVPAGHVRSWRFLIFWSGLRGALSLALVLALPLTIPDREALVFATYVVVLFTLLVQGFSLRFILRHMPALAESPTGA